MLKNLNAEEEIILVRKDKTIKCFLCGHRGDIEGFDDQKNPLCGKCINKYKIKYF